MVSTPCLQFLSSARHAAEHFRIQAFVPQLPIETLDVPYPVGEARLCAVGWVVVNWWGEELGVGGFDKTAAVLELGLGT